MMRMAYDQLSLSTVPITAFFDDRQISEATGFIWKRRDRYYLITNWHVVSAVDLFTKMHLSKSGARPNRLRCQFLIRVGHHEREPIDVAVRDENDEPLWLEHPAQEDIRAIDVIALPLDNNLKTRVALLPVNELATGKLAIMVGMDVFILGYPFGSKPPALPVWKRGSIASEPDLVLGTTGYYFVDTASRPGMSGSPVILRSRSNHILESNNYVARDNHLPMDKVIGVYSGRLHPTDAQIGIVWHIDYVNDIIDGDEPR
jgi:hypothetical protein